MSLFQRAEKSGQTHGIEDILLLQPGPSGDIHSILHIKKLGGVVGIGVDAHQNPHLLRPPSIDIIQVQTAGMGIDLQTGARTRAYL